MSHILSSFCKTFPLVNQCARIFPASLFVCTRGHAHRLSLAYGLLLVSDPWLAGITDSFVRGGVGMMYLLCIKSKSMASMTTIRVSHVAQWRFKLLMFVQIIANSWPCRDLPVRNQFYDNNSEFQLLWDKECGISFIIMSRLVIALVLGDDELRWSQLRKLITRPLFHSTWLSLCRPYYR